MGVVKPAGTRGLSPGKAARAAGGAASVGIALGLAIGEVVDAINELSTIAGATLLALFFYEYF